MPWLEKPCRLNPQVQGSHPPTAQVKMPETLNIPIRNKHPTDHPKTGVCLNLHLSQLGINLRFFWLQCKYLMQCYRYRSKSIHCNDL